MNKFIYCIVEEFFSWSVVYFSNMYRRANSTVSQHSKLCLSVMPGGTKGSQRGKLRASAGKINPAEYLSPKCTKYVLELG